MRLLAFAAVKYREPPAPIRVGLSRHSRSSGECCAKIALLIDPFSTSFCSNACLAIGVENALDVMVKGPRLSVAMISASVVACRPPCDCSRQVTTWTDRIQSVFSELL
jgi:hypothetical protein